MRRPTTHLAEEAGEPGGMAGPLFKFRPNATGLFSRRWESRFFQLRGASLQYFRSKKDTRDAPRGHVDLRDATLRWEGLKKDAYWAFSLTSSDGVLLLRLSSDKQDTAQHWVKELEAVGCQKRDDSPLSRLRGSMHGGGSSMASEGSTTSHYPGAASSELRAMGGLRQGDEMSSASCDRNQDGRQSKDYTSDSGVSEGGAMPTPAPRREKRRSKGTRGDLLGSTPLHTESRPSMLSADRIALTQHSGILNLMMLVLVCANARLIVENLIKYGVLVNPARWLLLLVPDGNVGLLLCWPALALCVLCALGVEKLGICHIQLEKKAAVAKRKRDKPPSEARREASRMAIAHEAVLGTLAWLNLAVVLGLPSFAVRRTRAEPVPAFVVMIISTICFMKLWSFWHCNQWLRKEQRRSELRLTMHRGMSRALSQLPGDDLELIKYPANIRLGNLAYFLIAPTLVYQTAYPRAKRFHRRSFIWLVGSLIAVIGVLLIIVEQYLVPTIANSLIPVRQADWVAMTERVLKLSLPTLYGWVFLFYCLFHLWLNILAELTLFGDREFYKDWWNATTIGDYWRLWNMPVHKWLLRHVYYPALRQGLGRTPAMVLVFFVSACFHELLVGWPLHMLRGWAFVGVMGQVPMVFATERLKKWAHSDQIGNLMFWVTFCIIGQPICLILYYHDWVLLNRPAWVEQISAAAATHLHDPKLATGMNQQH